MFAEGKAFENIIFFCRQPVFSAQLRNSWKSGRIFVLFHEAKRPFKVAMRYSIECSPILFLKTGDL